MAVSGKVGVPFPLTMILEDGNEVQFPQANVFVEGATAPTATIDLPHKTLGYYQAPWTPLAVGVYTIVFVTYSDAGHTVESLTYTRAVEQLLVSNNEVDDLMDIVVRILGLVHENVYIDNTIFDAYGQLVASRVRVFDSSANMDAATDGGSETTGLVATYEMSTDYEAECRMGTYKMRKV